MKGFQAEVHDFVKAKAPGLFTSELLELVNAEFGPIFTKSSLKAFKSNHGYNGNIRGPSPAGLPTKLWPEEVREFIKENTPGIGPLEMMDMINAEFETNYTHQQVESYFANHKIRSGTTGYFLKGHTPWNKGQKKDYPGGEATQFKSGHLPQNYKPVGTERINMDGYVEVKVADPSKWRPKHLVVWEEANGPVPEGHCVVFADTNRMNVLLDNLLLITRRQLAVMCRKGLFSPDPEATKAGCIVAEICLKISERKKELKKGGRQYGESNDDKTENRSVHNPTERD